MTMKSGGIKTTEKKVPKKMVRIGPVQEKILLLLLGGLTLGLTYSPKRYYRIVKEMRREWKNINARSLNNSIHDLYRSKLITMKEKADRTLTITLNESGKISAITRHLSKVEIPRMEKWDKKWRLLLFDVPQSMKKSRDAFRFHIKRMGFIEFQKSVFICPWECKKDVDFVIEFHGLRRFARYLIADSFDNEIDLKRQFGMI